MLGVKFTNGTVLPIFRTEQITVPGGQVEQYTLENAFLFLGGSGWNAFVRPASSFSMIDLTGNLWAFTILSTTQINIKITAPSSAVLYNRNFLSNYDINNGWGAYLVFVRNESNNMVLSISERRPSFSYLDTRQVLRASYLNSDFGGGAYDYETDLQRVTASPSYVAVNMRNNITSASPFTSIVGAVKYNNDTTVSDENYYLSPYAAGSDTAETFVLSDDTVVDIRPEPEDTDPYSPGGPSEPSGPNSGTWTLENDDIDFPALPTISAADSGFFSIWTPTLEQIQLLAQFMWTTDLTNIDTWKRLVANPIELILGLSLFPFDMTPDGHEPLTIGIINSRIETNYRDSQFFDIDCGTIDLEEYYGAFLDYAPYTELDIYLPYIGVRTINVNDVMPKTLHLRYRIDLVTGSCVAMLKADNSVFYHFSGSCAIQIPVTTYQMQDMIKSAISAATSIIGGIATGGVAGALAAVSGTSSAVASAGQHASRSGAIGSAAGFLSVQKPYLIITRPRQAVPASQNTFTGYPAFITAELGELSGYTEIEMVHLHDVPATSEELDEIERLLTEGVIF